MFYLKYEVCDIKGLIKIFLNLGSICVLQGLWQKKLGYLVKIYYLISYVDLNLDLTFFLGSIIW